MHILFNGCSYTWGDELENREEERYSTLVSNHYCATHSNIAECGVGNDAITRKTIQWFNEGNTCDLAIIQWSLISRIEGYDLDNNRYLCVTTQTQYKWKEYYLKYYHDQLGIDTLFKNYYLLEQFFIQRNIKYFFLIHDCFDDLIYEKNSVWKNLIINKNLNVIRGNKKHNHTILINPCNDNIHFKGNKGHPNAIGHRIISDYIIDNVQLD
jgi:hypothetical protein